MHRSHLFMLFSQRGCVSLDMYGVMPVDELGVDDPVDNGKSG